MTIGWRPASKRHDREILKGFRCAADGAPRYQREVQSWFRARAVAETNAANPDEEAHLLLLFVEHELAGCVRHSRTPPLTDLGHVSARFIDYIAVARSYQGRRLDDGRRTSDLLLFLALAHAADVGTRTDAVAALVDERNDRARTLLARFGISSVVPRFRGPYDLVHGPWEPAVFVGRLPPPIDL